MRVATRDEAASGEAYAAMLRSEWRIPFELSIWPAWLYPARCTLERKRMSTQQVLHAPNSPCSTAMFGVALECNAQATNSQA